MGFVMVELLFDFFVLSICELEFVNSSFMDCAVNHFVCLSSNSLLVFEVY